MVQVQSSWFPLMDRNPQRFVKLMEARLEDFQPATQTVFHAGQASSISLKAAESPDWHGPHRVHPAVAPLRQHAGARHPSHDVARAADAAFDDNPLLRL